MDGDDDMAGGRVVVTMTVEDNSIDDNGVLPSTSHQAEILLGAIVAEGVIWGLRVPKPSSGFCSAGVGCRLMLEESS
jgi:hypothetical protein